MSEASEVGPRRRPRPCVAVQHPDMYRAIGPVDHLKDWLGIDPTADPRADTTREQIAFMWTGLGQETQTSLWGVLDDDQRERITESLDHTALAQTSPTSQTGPAVPGAAPAEGVAGADAASSLDSETHAVGPAVDTDAQWYAEGVPDTGAAQAGDDLGAGTDSDADADGDAAGDGDGADQ